MAAGFNGARLHQKVFEPRFLYWADKLGYLVWGEFPNWGLNYTQPREPSPRSSTSGTRCCGATATIRRSSAGARSTRPAPTRPSPCLEIVLACHHARHRPDPARSSIRAATHISCQRRMCLMPTTTNRIPTSFARSGPTTPCSAGPAATRGTINPAEPHSRYRGQPFFVSEYGGIHVKTARDTGIGWGYGGRVRRWTTSWRATRG